MSHLAATTAAVRPNTRVVWLETPSNPGMDLIDIAGVVEIARTVGAEVAVDNTFATPVVQRPLTLGADVVMHSMTKYIGGHSDVQGGALVFRKNDDRVSRIANIRKICGGVLSPFNAWMALRGLRSLGCRVRQQSATALAIAEFLSSHPGVEATHYPGLPSQPGHAIARRQMKGFGGMLSLCVRGGQDEALRVASKLKLFINATSLGGTESLIEHRASVEGPSSVSPKNLLRMSVGLEDPDDLIEDLRQALEDG
jgi:cystathionine gamma-synthase